MLKKVLCGAAVAASSLFLVGGVAQAGEPAPAYTPPPEFAPPAPAPVTDTLSAESFAKLYAARNASRFLGQDRRRVRVLDANAACLQHPVIATRFGCVFTLRALVIQRNRGWDGWDARSARTASKRGDHPRRVRIRNFGCLGFLRINGGPTVTPSAQLLNVECARVARDDIVAPEPTY